MFLESLRQVYKNLEEQSVLTKYVEYLVKLVYLGNTRASLQGQTRDIEDIGLTTGQFNQIVQHAQDALHSSSINQHVLVFRIVADQLTGFNNRKRWVEKTPSHVLHLDTIFATIPDVKVIEMVRDPRATLASKKARTTSEWQDSREAKGAIVNRELLFDPIIDSYRWRQHVKAGENAGKQYPDQLMRIRYEDLVRSPEANVKRITNFLGIEYRPELMDVNVVNATAISPDDNQKGIRTVAVDKWRKSLSPEELHFIQLILRRDMAELQYDRVPSDAGVITWAKTPFIFAQSAAQLGNRVLKKANIK